MTNDYSTVEERIAFYSWGSFFIKIAMNFIFYDEKIIAPPHNSCSFMQSQDCFVI